MIVTLAFKKYTSSTSENIGSRLIKWWTKSNYSHVELIIEDKWISSTSSGGGLHIYDLRELTDKWDYINVEVDGDLLEPVMVFAKSQQNTKYDWSGIVWAQIFQISRGQNQDKWFCSEIVAELLKRFKSVQITERTAAYDPGELFEIYT